MRALATVTRGACVVLLTGLALAACGGDPYALPPRTPEVVAEEERVARLLERRAAGTASDPTCAVRVLGRDGPSTFAWRHCEMTYDGEVRGGVSGPVRVDGPDVREPVDGAGYGDSVRAMFPADLAEAVLEDGERLRPGPP